MAHCAEINQDGVVVRVIVVDETYGDLTCEEWCQKTLGGTWKKTSYNTCAGINKDGGVPLRKNYAGPGFTYDKTLDAFVPPQPHASWKLNEATCQWEAPVERPKTGEWTWDEKTQTWVPFVLISPI